MKKTAQEIYQPNRMGRTDSLTKSKPNLCRPCAIHSPLACIHALQKAAGNRTVRRFMGANKSQMSVASPFTPSTKPEFNIKADAPHGIIQRAAFMVGSLSVQIDYGNLASIPATRYQQAIETSFTTYTGRPAGRIRRRLRSLTTTQKVWVLYGLDLLMDNTTPAHSRLNRVQAVRRLIARAPSASTSPSAATFDFEREIMRVSGWFETALAARIAPPTAADRAVIGSVLNPAAGRLRRGFLRREIPRALMTLFRSIRPRGATGTDSFTILRRIADLIQAEARRYFRPYADTAMQNRYSSGWIYSANISPTRPRGGRVSNDLRISYLLNRARIVGRDTRSGPSIFSRAHFDSRRFRDMALLTRIVRRMASQGSVRRIVDPIIQRTGRASGGRIGISTEYDTTRFNACQARWDSIHTLGHELIHVLQHPDFGALADRVNFRQVIQEGFTEVLGNQFYNLHIRPQAAAPSAFKTQMEAGLSGAPCPDPPVRAVGYREAGAGAQQILNRVHDDRFRAAYFLGANHLIGF